MSDIFYSSTYGPLVGVNDTTLKSKVLDQYQNLEDISDDDFSTYLSHLSVLLKNAALAVVASTPSQTLPQTASAGVSIDGLYAAYLGLSTSMVASKSSYDSLLASATSLAKADNLQVDTIDTSLQSLSDNKWNIIYWFNMFYGFC